MAEPFYFIKRVIINSVSLMGLFGNKEGKENIDPKAIKEALIAQTKNIQANVNQLVVVSEAVPAINVFEGLFSQYDGVRETLQKNIELLRDFSQIKELISWRKHLFAYFFCPLSTFYASIPENVTDFKYEAFGNYSYKERLFGLEALTLLVTIATFNRKKAQLGAISRLLYSTRNASVSYLLGGLLIAPEIYNPLIKADF